MSATIPTPDLPSRDSAAELLSVEEAAYHALTQAGPLTDTHVLSIWEACQRTQTRDPLITRILLEHPALRTRAVDRLTTALTRLDGPNAEMLTVAGMLTWSTGGDERLAVLMLTLAVENGAQTCLAELLLEGIPAGLPRDTWILAIAAELTLDQMRTAPVEVA